MLWSLYVWHSEMVIHLLALSEIPKHLCGHSQLFTQFQKSRRVWPTVFEVLSGF